MDIKTIMRKQEVSQDEMEFVISEYIFEKKGVRPDINIEAGLPPGIHPQMRSIILSRQVELLSIAYNTAWAFFIKKYKDINATNMENNS